MNRGNGRQVNLHRTTVKKEIPGRAVHPRSVASSGGTPSIVALETQTPARPAAYAQHNFAAWNGPEQPMWGAGNMMPMTPANYGPRPPQYFHPATPFQTSYFPFTPAPPAFAARRAAEPPTPTVNPPPPAHVVLGAQLTCPQCDQTLPFNLVDKHIRIHKGYTPLQCGPCDLYFYSKEDVDLHKRTVHHRGPSKIISVPDEDLENQCAVMRNELFATLKQSTETPQPISTAPGDIILLSDSDEETASQASQNERQITLPSCSDVKAEAQEDSEEETNRATTSTPRHDSAPPPPDFEHPRILPAPRGISVEEMGPTTAHVEEEAEESLVTEPPPPPPKRPVLLPPPVATPRRLRSKPSRAPPTPLGRDGAVTPSPVGERSVVCAECRLEVGKRSCGPQKHIMKAHIKRFRRQCGYCNRGDFWTESKTTKDHFRTEHKGLPVKMIDVGDEIWDELCSLMGRCFGLAMREERPAPCGQMRPPPPRRKAPLSGSIVKRIRMDLADPAARPATLTCRACAAAVPNKSEQRMYHIMRDHIKQVVFRCRFCPFASREPERVREIDGHMATVHPTKEVKEVDDLRKSLIPHIEREMNACFGLKSTITLSK